MSQRRNNFPVMLGHHLRKGIFVSRDTKMGGFNLLIVWLNKDYQSGETYDIADIEAIDTHLHFCDRESVKQTIKSLEWILDHWKEER